MPQQAVREAESHWKHQEITGVVCKGNSAWNTTVEKGGVGLTPEPEEALLCRESMRQKRRSAR